MGWNYPTPIYIWKLRLFLVVLTFVLFLPNIAIAKTGKESSKSSYESALEANNYIRTKKILQKVISQPIPTENEKAKTWYRALFALINLERLVGSQRQARILFARCEVSQKSNISCREVATSDEWRAIRNWACKAEPLPAPCVEKP